MRAVAGGFVAGLVALCTCEIAIGQAKTEAEGPLAACELAPGGSATVADVIDGDTLVLADGRVVRLAGVEAPKPYLARSSAGVGALAEAARRELRDLAGDKTVVLHFGEHASDRHGRLLAHLRLADDTWLQEAMVAAGMARIRPFAGDVSCLDDLRGPETDARDADLGLWRDPEFSVISAYDSSLIKRKGLYVVVEGRVLSVGHGNRLDFLNFGHNWQRDFTVLVAASVSARLAKQGLPVESMVGKWVRVRGIVEDSGGPAIRLRSAGEIEVLDDD